MPSPCHFTDCIIPGNSTIYCFKVWWQYAYFTPNEKHAKGEESWPSCLPMYDIVVKGNYSQHAMVTLTVDTFQVNRNWHDLPKYVTRKIFSVHFQRRESSFEILYITWYYFTFNNLVLRNMCTVYVFLYIYMDVLGGKECWVFVMLE